MAVPSITQLTQVEPADSNTWTAAAVAGAGFAIPQVTSTVIDGIDGTTACQTLEAGNNTVTSGNRYSAWNSLTTSVDISGDNQALIMHYSGNSASFSRISSASDAIQVALFSGGGTTEYARWDLGGFGDPIHSGIFGYHPVILHSSPDFTTASYDNTDITGIGIVFLVGLTGTFNLTAHVDQIMYLDGEVSLDGGEVANPGSWDAYYDILKPTSGTTQHSLLLNKVGTAYEALVPIKINSDYWRDTEFAEGLFGFGFSTNDGIDRPLPSTGYYSLNIQPPALGDVQLSNGQMASANAFPFTLDGSLCTALDLDSCLVAPIADGDTTGSALEMSNSTLIGNTSPLEVAEAPTNDVSYTLKSSTAGGIRITGAAGDYSTLKIDFAASITGDDIALGDGGAGTYDLTGVTVESGHTLTVRNNSATNAITVELASGTSVSTSTAGGTITISSPAVTFTVNSSEANSTIRIFTTGTQTELDSATGSSLAYVHSSETVDYTVQKAGFLPQRFTGVALSGTTSVTVNLVASREYDASHGLTYTTDASWSRTNNELTVPTFGPTGRQVFSLMLDSFISESALRNTAFNIEMDGASSLYLTNGAEGNADSSIENLTGCGCAYLDSGGTTTASWVGVQSVGDSTGFTGEYQQVDGSGTTDARATGVFNQLIKVYGDVTHGNFDYQGHLVLKYQPNGYYQSRADLLDSFGISSLEPTLYIVAMEPASTGLATGDPAISITITDHTASPITVGGKLFDYEVVDNGANSAEDILREINYNLSLDATYQGKDPFNYPDMVIESGGNYETQQGGVEGQDTTTTSHGFYVSRSSSDHPDFTRFQSNDGTYYVAPVLASATISNIVSGSRVRIYNNTTATETYNDIPGTSYSDSYTEGTTYTDGDSVTVTITQQSGTTAKAEFTGNLVASSSGWTLVASQVDDDVYNLNAVDGSLITKFSADYVNDEVDLTVGSNFTAQEFYAWWVYNNTTSQGIAEFFGGVTAIDAANYRFNVSVVDIYFDNTTTSNYRATDEARTFRSDEAYPVRNDGATSGGGGLDVNWKNVVYLATTGSALTAAQDATLSSIDSKTAPLTATVGNQIDVNIKSVNDVTVTGTGSAGDEWGP